MGWNYYAVPGGVQTSCSDAAVAASWIIDNCSTCPQDKCLVEGMLFPSYCFVKVAFSDSILLVKFC